MGWIVKKNGELLSLMTKNNCDLFVTVDRILRYQQNLEGLTLTIIVLCAYNNTRDTLRLLVPKIFERLAEGAILNVIEIA